MVWDICDEVVHQGAHKTGMALPPGRPFNNLSTPFTRYISLFIHIQSAFIGSNWDHDVIKPQV